MNISVPTTLVYEVLVALDRVDHISVVERPKTCLLTITGGDSKWVRETIKEVMEDARSKSKEPAQESK